MARKGKLVILDLNGLVLFRVYKKNVPDEYKEFTKMAKTCGSFYVWQRPHLKEFLNYLFEHFYVAVWTSASQYNAELLVKSVFGEYETQLQFVWTQSHCEKVENPDNEDKPLFLKPIQKVWDVYPEFNQLNTLLIDDTEQKARNNPPFLLYAVVPWTIAYDDDDALVTNIMQWLRGLYAWKGSVPSYVRLVSSYN